MTAHVGFVSLGCPKALVDSERILTQLRAEGYGISADYDGADVVIVNTCGFIESAIAESMDAIGEAMQDNGRVIVTGCLGVDRQKILEAYPGVLAVSGPHAYEEVMGAVHKVLPRPHDAYADLLPPGGIKLTPRHYAYLKIAEGCDHSCTFCIIPSLRGPMASRDAGDIVREAEALAAAGVKELIVIAQDTPAYGRDLRHRASFAGGRPVKARLTELLEALRGLGLWLRVLYAYPHPSVDELVPLMADGLLLPYLDMPLQHADHGLLRAMRRPANQERMLDRIAGWRGQCPDIALRSTFIVGFPGETEEQFESLLQFVEEASLDRVGCFTYSAVAGAEANTVAEPVPEEVKLERQARLMELQENISAERLDARVGSRCRVLVDAVDDDGIVARSYAEAPEIDGVIYVVPGEADEVRAGDFLEVEIEEAGVHDLWAATVD